MSGENLLGGGTQPNQERKSLQNLDEAAEGTVIRSNMPGESRVDAPMKANEYFGDTGDKSYESLKAEASGSDGGHTLSNETPGKQDAIGAVEDKAAKGEITDRELRQKLGVIEQKHQQFSPIGDQTVTAAPSPKLAIERFIEPGVKPVGGLEQDNVQRDEFGNEVHHTTTNSFVMTDENKAEYKRLLEEVEKSRGNRQLGDIPLSDEYWSKQNRITLFLSNLKT